MKVIVHIKLWCDNQVAIHISNNLIFHELNKHIEVDCHFVREKVQQGLLSTVRVWSGDQLADIVTKRLNKNGVKYICNKLGMVDIYAPVCGEC